MKVTSWNLHHGSYQVELNLWKYLMEPTPGKLPHGTYAMGVTLCNLHHGSYHVDLTLWKVPREKSDHGSYLMELTL